MGYETVLKSIKSKLGNTNLMAVSKTRTVDEIMAVYKCGVKLFGENHVQEIVEKFSTPRPDDMKVHMIGHLQSNKVGKVVPLVDMIESVDSFELLKKIDRACEKIGKVMPVLLELNTSGEEAKSGFASVEELKECIRLSCELKNVVVKGLMTVGPVQCSSEEKDELTRTAFRKLKKVYDEYGSFSVLSMGMSGDFEIGVQEGSTQVRIGTLIFGERNYV